MMTPPLAYVKRPIVLVSRILLSGPRTWADTVTEKGSNCRFIPSGINPVEIGSGASAYSVSPSNVSFPSASV